MENDIGETSNYDIGNITTCSGCKKGLGEEGQGTKGSKKGIERSRETSEILGLMFQP